jgi:lysophospholipase L1-like esterase
MILNAEQIKSIAHGVAQVTVEDGKICLYRFTEDQRELYRGYSSDFFSKSFASAGITLELVTDSSRLGMKVEVKSGSSRKFFAHSIYVNGEKYATLGCEKTNCGIFGGEWTLPAGENTVKIYFPFSTASRIISFELDDGATLTPVEKPVKMLMFGDSITHGYDCRSPENSYAFRVSDALGAEAINKGIGGEIFFPELAALRDDIEPDYITVAYGTNDWTRNNKEGFERKCKAFYETLSANYPKAKIFAITPIWRNRHGDPAVNSIGSLAYIGEYIKKVTAALPNVTVIDGTYLVPHNAKFFAPDILHPNDEGFEYYAKNLLTELKKHL